ncbi:hypothetical protein [Candidatus Poriferisocius sp.]|uniref:hypothetical protein n=1 Tax=Candidatus Poriferisocius sp. TaxID=3101276 RepID=UPI003B51AC51
MGLSDGAKLARFTVAPVSTFTNSTDGRSESGSGVGSGVGGGVGRGVGAGVGSGVGAGVGCGVEAGVGCGAWVGCGVEAGVGCGAWVGCGVEAGVGCGAWVGCGVEAGVGCGAWVGAGSEAAAASVDSVAGVSSGSGSPGEEPMLSDSEVGSAEAATSVESGSDEGWSGVWVLVGAAAGSDSAGGSSRTEVSEPPQAAATRVKARARAKAAHTLDCLRERDARMLTP